MSQVECSNCARPVADGAAICTTCSTALAEQLRGVPDLVDDLLITLAKQDQLSSGAGRGRNEQPLPLRMDIPDAVWVLGNVVTTWARDVSEAAGLRVDARQLRRPQLGYDARNGSGFVNSDRCGLTDLPVDMCAHCRGHQLVDGARPDERLTTLRPLAPRVLGWRPPTALDSMRFAALWLAERIGYLRRIPAAVDAHDEISDAINQANTACGAPPLRLFVGACATCEADLYGWPDHRAIKCPRCDKAYTDMAQRWDQAKFRLRGYPATAATIARFAGELYGQRVNADTIRKWHNRGDLTPVDWVPLTEGGQRTVPRFRIGAVLDRAAKSKPSKAG